MRIGIINYGMGNLRSVRNAFHAVGGDAGVAERPEDLAQMDAVVLPGVGAFGDGMANLHAQGWVQALEEQVRRQGKPFIGLCLGQQLLATKGTEHGDHSGLGWIAGTVDRLASAPGLRIPQIGWNDVRFTPGSRMYAGLGESRNFYFVHSFVLRPDDASQVNGVCEHGETFCASIERDNIWATQYHPEKSQHAGLAVLKNFLTAWS